eukprot:10972331-Alexandrium_andersonii.AAC.1
MSWEPGSGSAISCAHGPENGCTLARPSGESQLVGPNTARGGGGPVRPTGQAALSAARNRRKSEAPQASVPGAGSAMMGGSPVLFYSKLRG